MSDTLEGKPNILRQPQEDTGSFGITLAKPKFPQYAVVSRRIESFKSWPENFPVSADALAEAGLVYTGKDDGVRCYYCGGGLCGWRRGDIPWEEHAKEYPSCPHVLLVKGQAYVDRAKRGEDPDLDEPIDQTVAEHTSPEDLINTTAAEACFQMGYTKKKITQAIDRFVKSTGAWNSYICGGGTNFKGEDLCRILFDMEDEALAMAVPSSHNAAREDVEARNIEPAINPPAVAKGLEPEMEGEEPVTEEERPLMEEEEIVAPFSRGLFGLFCTWWTKRRSCQERRFSGENVNVAMISPLK